MKIKWIKFKVSTKDYVRCSCVGCEKKEIKGKGGHIKFSLKEGWFNNRILMVLCLDCFDKFIKQIEKDRKNKSKLYNKLRDKMLIRDL